MELDWKILDVYRKLYPSDSIVCGDAHQYLLEHFKEFDFIWSSPPCPSHSSIRLYTAVAKGANDPIFPDMKLYEEIIFLQYYFKGKWCVENVISYYDPLIAPQKLGSHYFWTNFLIPPVYADDRNHHAHIKELATRKGFNLDDLKGLDKVKVLRNCVEPELGKQILEYAINPIKLQKEMLFS